MDFSATAGLERQARDFWKHIVRKLPPAKRQAWLKTQEAICALGAKRCRDLLKDVESQCRRIEDESPSGAWIEARAERGEKLPAGMVMSVVSGRYTPPQCLESEDALDEMSEMQAMFYVHPPSPSAEAIRRHFGQV